MAEIVWEAPEFEYREKGVSWYWLSIVVAVIVLGIAVWQRNFLFGFFVVIAEILILSWGNREPKMASFTLNEKGLAISGGKFYAMQDLESFSAEEAELEWQNIYIQLKSRIKPRVKIPAPKKRFRDIQKLLGARLSQLDYEPSLLDTLERFVGF